MKRTTSYNQYCDLTSSIIGCRLSYQFSISILMVLIEMSPFMTVPHAAIVLIGWDWTEWLPRGQSSWLVLLVFLRRRFMLTSSSFLRAVSNTIHPHLRLFRAIRFCSPNPRFTAKRSFPRDPPKERQFVSFGVFATVIEKVPAKTSLLGHETFFSCYIF